MLSPDSHTLRRHLVTWALLFAASRLGGPAAAAEAPALVDYGAQFDKSFPVLGGEHRVADWALYTALIHGDLLGYAARVDPTVARQRELAKGKGYRLQELQAGVQRNQRLRSAFDAQRLRIASMVLYTDGGSAESCHRPIVFIGSEFRLILGGLASGTDPLAGDTVAPSCPPPFAPGVQITGGHSPRFRCWAGVYDKTCGWRLPDMPADLKRVIEDQYPTTIKVRWRWRGLGAALTAPEELGLEFVDGQGRVLWTAVGARITTPPAQPRAH